MTYREELQKCNCYSSRNGNKLVVEFPQRQEGGREANKRAGIFATHARQHTQTEKKNTKHKTIKNVSKPKA